MRRPGAIGGPRREEELPRVREALRRSLSEAPVRDESAMRPSTWPIFDTSPSHPAGLGQIFGEPAAFPAGLEKVLNTLPAFRYVGDHRSG